MAEVAVRGGATGEGRSAAAMRWRSRALTAPMG